MFCVKIILNIANSSNESDNKKKQLVEKLTNVYIEAIKR
jgi:phenylpyruvate tautomerase PptA (4-oxalocrotonate tautomerase family)